MSRGILITRAADQTGPLKAVAEAMGYLAYLFPVLDINFVPSAQLHRSLEEIKAEDLLVFVSMNAVHGVFNQDGAALNPLIAKAMIVAVGARTRQALLDAGLEVSVQAPNDQQNTEGLLQHPALQNMSGRRVFIIRAQSGRDTLKRVLTERGASVHYIQAYQRGMPLNFDASATLEALSNKAIDVVLLTSYDGFQNLMKMLGAPAEKLLQQVCLIVPSARVAEKILSAYPFDVRVAGNASDEEMLACVERVNQVARN